MRMSVSPPSDVGGSAWTRHSTALVLPMQRKSADQARFRSMHYLASISLMVRPHAGSCSAGRNLSCHYRAILAPHPWDFKTLLPSAVVLVLGPNAALSFRTLARSGSPGLPILSGFLLFLHVHLRISMSFILFDWGYCRISTHQFFHSPAYLNSQLVSCQGDAQLT